MKPLKSTAKFRTWMCVFISVLMFLPAIIHAENLALSETQLKERIKIFYPVNGLKEKQFKVIIDLVKKDDFPSALKKAQALANAYPQDLNARYCLQAVKSYSLVAGDWRFRNDTPSSLLTFMAWIEMHNRNYDKAIELAKKCIDDYAQEGVYQQAQLKDFPSKKAARSFWALNDVGTCTYILGEAYYQKKDYQKAYDSFKSIEKSYSFAQCYDPSKGFWKAVDAGSKKMRTLVARHGIQDTDIRPTQYAKKDGNVFRKEPVEARKKEVLSSGITVTEELITRKEIQEQVQKVTSENKKEPFAKNALEELLIEDIEPEDFMSGPEKTHTAEKAKEEKVHVATLQEREEAKHREEMDKKREELEGIKKEIYMEKQEILKALKRLGEPPVISVVLKEGKEEEALGLLKKQRKEIQGLLADKIKEEQSEQKKLASLEQKETEERSVDTRERKLKETIVYVRKDLVLKWTNQTDKTGLFEVIVERKNQSPEVKQFRDIQEFYAFAENLGFAI